MRLVEIRAAAVCEAEFREPVHGNSVFLINPGEFQPELPLRFDGRRPPARTEKPQRRVAPPGKLEHARLEGRELRLHPARGEPHHRGRSRLGRTPAQRLELTRRTIELRDDLAVSKPGFPELANLCGTGAVEAPARALVLALDATVLTLQPIQTIPERGVEPFGSRLCRCCTHRPSPCPRYGCPGQEENVSRGVLQNGCRKR